MHDAKDVLRSGLGVATCVKDFHGNKTPACLVVH